MTFSTKRKGYGTILTGHAWEVYEYNTKIFIHSKANKENEPRRREKSR